MISLVADNAKLMAATEQARWQRDGWSESG